MDVQATKQEIEGFLTRIGDPHKQAELRARMDSILARHAAETDPARRTTIEAELSTLRSEAETEAGRPGQPRSPGGGAGGGGAGGGGGGGEIGFLTTGGFRLVLLITVLSFAFLFYYFWLLRAENFRSAESIRPLLVLTLILSMLGFGGLLIVRALFAPYDGQELQNRFRLGREIFLVFSGIFGTIIGFYFASEDSGSAPKALSLQVAATTPRDLTVTVQGGSPPYRGILTLEGGTSDVYARAQDAVLKFTTPADSCPRGADIIVVDGRGGLAETEVPQSNESLRAAGWTACPADGGASENSSGNASGNPTNTANQTVANGAGNSG